MARTSTGYETLCLTDAGIQLLAEARRHGRRSSTAHDRLAQRMAQHLMATGRVVWRELSFLAQSSRARESAACLTRADSHLPFGEMPLAISSSKYKSDWRLARPDVFSVRNTSVEEYLHPMVHEIKSNRADLLSDLRNTAKRSSYQWLCCECYYVFPRGVAEVQEIPEELGVWVLDGSIEDGGLRLLRPALHSPCKLPFTVWLTLAKAAPMPSEADLRQSCLPALPEQNDAGPSADDHERRAFR